MAARRAESPESPGRRPSLETQVVNKVLGSISHGSTCDDARIQTKVRAGEQGSKKRPSQVALADHAGACASLAVGFARVLFARLIAQ